MTNKGADPSYYEDFFLILWSFFEKIWEIYAWHPPLRYPCAHLAENPESASGNSNLDNDNVSTVKGNGTSNGLISRKQDLLYA